MSLLYTTTPTESIYLRPATTTTAAGALASALVPFPPSATGGAGAAASVPFPPSAGGGGGGGPAAPSSGGAGTNLSSLSTHHSP
jgi:hypothetical protein